MSARILLLLSLLAFPFISPGQTLIDRSYETDFRMGFQDGLQLEDGSILFVVTGSPFTGFDSTQSVLVKMDTALNVLWAKRYKGYSRDDFASITQLADGNILVTGTVRTPALAPEGGAVFKMDTAGNILWHQVYDDSFDDRIIAAFEQADSTFIMIDRKGVTNNPTKILYTTDQGNLITSRAYESNGQGLLVDEAAADGSGTYYLVGDRNNNGQSELFIMALTDSSLEWVRAYDFGRSIFPTDALCDSAGKLLIAAGIEDTTTFFNTSNAVLMEINTSTGDLNWAQEIGQDQPYSNLISDIKYGPEKRLFGSGIFFTDEGNNSWAFESDEMGNLIWWKGYYQFDNQSASSLLSLADGRLLMAGNARDLALVLAVSDSGQSSCSDTTFVPLTNSLTPDSVYTPVLTMVPPTLIETTPTISIFPITISDSLICKRVLAATTSIGSEALAEVRLFPNPTSGNVHVEWQEQEPAEMQVISLQGQILESVRLQPQQIGTISLASYPKGIYLLRIQAGERVLTRKIVKE